MFLFLAKTVVAIIIISLAFCFYGNVTDHLFIKMFFCVLFLLTTYWVDIYRLTKLFGTYFFALKRLKEQKFATSYKYFEALLQMDFAPSLPYLAIMKFKGTGTSINIEAAKYYCERAIRNNYHECLYLLAVINFFGNSLDSFFTNNNETTTENTKVKPRRGTYQVLEPDYRECVFHMHQYLTKCNEKDSYYPEALAMLGYCLATGKGIDVDIEQAKFYFNKAKLAGSKNVAIFEKSLHDSTNITTFNLDFA